MFALTVCVFFFIPVSFYVPTLRSFTNDKTQGKKIFCQRRVQKRKIRLAMRRKRIIREGSFLFSNKKRKELPFVLQPIGASGVFFNTAEET